MQLSRDEFIKVSQLEPARTAFGGRPIGNVATAPLRRVDDYSLPAFSVVDEAELIADLVGSQADQREDIVDSLRSRIEAGTYRVTGDQVADMMVRRLLADQMR